MAEAPARPKERPVGTESRPLTTSEEILERLKTCHDEAYLYVEQALCCDEHGQRGQALSLYKKGLESVNKAKQYAITVPNIVKSGSKWEATQTKLTKLEKTKLQIEYRIQELGKDVNETSQEGSSAMQTGASRSDDLPPTYDVAISNSALDSIMEEAEEGNANLDFERADELLKIPDGVQMFYISPQGMVSAPSYPSSLSIFKFTQEEASSSNDSQRKPPAFLRVGNWVYPLSQGVSPALQAESGAYVFPDLERGEGESII